MIQTVLSILAAMLSVYTLLCFVYILMSWLPGAKFTRFGHIMTAICEPYMGLFRKLGFLRIGNIDFSPIVSLGILSLASAILEEFSIQEESSSAEFSELSSVLSGELLHQLVLFLPF